MPLQASPLTAGTAAPAFSGPIQDGSSRSLSDYAGRKLALYFYPKDMTPGCTAQACNLTEHFDALEAAGIAVLGVSPDPVAKHVKFTDKHDLKIDLLADEDLAVHKAFGVWGLKKFMGRSQHICDGGTNMFGLDLVECRKFGTARQWVIRIHVTESKYQKLKKEE